MIALTDAQSTAIITGVFGVLLAVIKLGFGLRKLSIENKKQHDENRISSQADMAALAAQLDMVHDDVKTSRVELRDDINRVHERMNDHLRDHHDSLTPPAKKPAKRRKAE